MWMDVVELQEFYKTSLGLWVRRLLRSRLKPFIGPCSQQAVLGVGYPLPYMKLFREVESCSAVLMPAQQGVVAWPPRKSPISVLAEETAFPFPDRTFDILFYVHGLEFSQQTHQMLRESWRILKDSGKLIILVPNRLSIWSRAESTPFGHGRPYTQGQLSTLLRKNFFVPTRHEGILYMPPVKSRFIRASSFAWEQLGRRWLSLLPGVLMVEASKQLYASPPISTEFQPFKSQSPSTVKV